MTDKTEPEVTREALEKIAAETGLYPQKGVFIWHGRANSHCFEDAIVIDGKCIAFADEPQSTAILDALTSTAALQERIDALEALLREADYQLGGETAAVKKRFADWRSSARAALK